MCLAVLLHEACHIKTLRLSVTEEHLRKGLGSRSQSYLYGRLLLLSYAGKPRDFPCLVDGHEASGLLLYLGLRTFLELLLQHEINGEQTAVLGVGRIDVG